MSRYNGTTLRICTLLANDTIDFIKFVEFIKLSKLNWIIDI